MDLLAIAHAAAGDFPKAKEAAQKALKLAEQADKQESLPSLRTKLQLFRAKKPYYYS